MLAIVAAVLFLLALIVQLIPGISLGVITWSVLAVAGLLCLALHSAGIGNRRLL